jgi:predicted transcriptional regulator
MLPFSLYVSGKDKAILSEIKNSIACDNYRKLHDNKKEAGKKFALSCK